MESKRGKAFWINFGGSMRFDILDPTVDIHRNYLIEASAGTGKTFAIENLYVRLLQEPFKGKEKALTLDQIGVMTFTKAAARDLRKRIRSNLAQKMEGNSALQEALYAFDQAQIFTLHGFCSRALKTFSFEGGLSFESPPEEKCSSTQRLRQIVHDAFRMKIKGIHPVQITLLVHQKKYRQQTLEEELVKILEKRGKIAPPPTLEELFAPFLEGLAVLRQHNFNRLIDDYSLLLPCLKSKGNEQCVAYFQGLLQKEAVAFEDFVAFLPHWEPLYNSFDPENRYKRKNIAAPLSHPDFFEELKCCLHTTMELAANPKMILAALGSHCQEVFRKWEEGNGTFSPDKLLTAMLERVQDPRFASLLRSKYRAIIVDEFQDTDPVQWEILQRLFLTDQYEGVIYLVGDPKQAIYAFRQGDVYTYLTAAKDLGSGAAVTLTTNYRSSPPLVEALNTLFNSARSLFELPKTGEEIPFQSVLAGKQGTFPQDGKGTVHFMECERSRGAIPDACYEAIAQEITQFPDKSIAILVSSAQQGNKMSAILQKWGIPSFFQRPPPLGESPMVRGLIEILQAVSNPRRLSALKVALGGLLLGWDIEGIKQLDQGEKLEEQLLQFYHWQQLLKEKGISPFLQQFVKTCSCRLLARESGDNLFQNLLQLGELLTEHQAKTHCAIPGLIDYLRELESEGEEGPRQLLQTKGAVQIVTIHSSKGLEYDIVFAPGVLSPPAHHSEQFVADATGAHLHPILDPQCDERFQHHKRELDGERMRLLYVALTRAKERVYIPICFNKTGNSPLDLFLRKLEKPFHTYLCETITLAKIQEHYPLPERIVEKKVLTAPLPLIVPGEAKVLHSFSSLAETLEHAPQQFSGAPSDLNTSLKTIHTLPSGSAIGNLFHTLFEKIPFTASIEEIEKGIAGHLRQSGLNGWDGVIGDALFNTFNTPLPLRTGECALAGMGELSCYKEMEFCYPYRDGYLKGVIDLIFFYKGYYYLLDWKSNWLGKDPSAYTQEHLTTAMDQHNYSLQGTVYRNALESYLSQVDPRPFEQIYGGMFYLFFRGMHPLDRDKKGIFIL